MPQRNKHTHQTFRPHLTLSLLIALVAAQALPTYAQNYSDCVRARQPRPCYQLDVRRSTARDLEGWPEPVLHV